jgi:hypothetical protein
MITNEHIKEFLGDDYDPAVAYLIADKGPALAAKVRQGCKNHGRLPDDLTAGDTELYLLSPPIVVPKPKLVAHAKLRRPVREPDPPGTVAPDAPVAAKPKVAAKPARPVATQSDSHRPKTRFNRPPKPKRKK